MVYSKRYFVKKTINNINWVNLERSQDKHESFDLFV